MSGWWRWRSSPSGRLREDSSRGCAKICLRPGELSALIDRASAFNPGGGYGPGCVASSGSETSGVGRLPAMTTRSPARPAIYARLSSFYAAYFFMVGLMLPYWPLWLDSRGLSTTQIGLVLSAMYWIKIVGQPLLARHADRRGDSRPMMIGLALLSLACLAAFEFASGLWLMMGLAALLGVFHHPILPLGESVTLRVARDNVLDYGRIRLWGSITFILASALGGVWLEGHAPSSVLWLIFGAQILVVLACIGMPASARGPTTVPASDIAALLVQPRFLLFLVVTGSIQTSHVILLGFGVLYWRDNGLPASVIGLLWSAGVVAEIILFAWIGRFGGAVSYPVLLGLGALGGLVRWPLTALTADPALLFPLQCLHALTFGATHLGAMMYLAETVPERLAATGQAVYAAIVGGLSMGLALPAGAWLFERAGGQAFHAMGGLCVIGLVGAMGLGRMTRRPS